LTWFSQSSGPIGPERLTQLMEQTVTEAKARLCPRPRRVLLLPPDITRAHSGAGRLTEMLYQLLAPEAEVHVIPTLGQHEPHTPEMNRRMFGSIPEERIHAHDWLNGCVRVGKISADYVRDVTRGKATWPIPIDLNRMLIEEPWNLVIHVGHVVPHEVLGFANHNKNYFIGLGGKETLAAAHMAAACYGIENNLGTLVTPVRACFNKAEQDFLGRVPALYVQIVMAADAAGHLAPCGLYVGNDLDTYLDAAQHARRENICVLDEPVPKIVCVMQGDEFFSTWVANKAVYRTRMALADGGELLIIAPGLKRFGEQPAVDALIRKYGYCGTPQAMEHYRHDPVLRDLAHAAAHLIHGSSEGRFKITYAQPNLSRAEIEGIHYGWADYTQTLARYPLQRMTPGWNTMADGERVYFIPTPAAGLWATKAKLAERR
jgi:nickel-dependent lactate racemase